MMAALGCAHWSSIPSREDLASKPIDQIYASYPDFKKFQIHFGRILPTIFDMPPANPLREKWEQPQINRLSWWNALPVAYLPILNMTKYWEWQIGDKRVKTWVVHSFAAGYQPRVWCIYLEPLPKSQ